MDPLVTPKIRAIGFDYYGVMSAESPRDFLMALSNHIGVLPEDFLRVYAQANHLLYQEKVITQDQLWDKVAELLGMPEKAIVAHAYFHSHQAPRLNPQMLELASQLRQHYKIGLLSNVSGEWAAALHALGFGAHFDAMLLSSEIGYSKPDPRAFQLLAEKLGVTCQELVFIDDQENYLSSLEGLGVTAILYTGFDELKTRLNQLGLINFIQ